MKDLEFGTVKIHLEELMKKRNISINKLSEYIPPEETQNQQQTPMEATLSHVVKNTTLILFYSQEYLFPFALTYGTALHKNSKCVNS